MKTIERLNADERAIAQALLECASIGDHQPGDPAAELPIGFRVQLARCVSELAEALVARGIGRRRSARRPLLALGDARRGL